MNRLYKILFILIIGLSSCNPMNDIYTQLDKQVQPPKATYSYTLTDADYSSISSAAKADATTDAEKAIAASIASTNSLPDGYAEKYIPAVLLELHPSLGKGSSANITYNYNNGYKTLTVDKYTLTDADYGTMGGAVAVYKYFSPSNPPEDYVPALLSTKYPDATDGSYEMVTYQYSTTDPQVGEVTVLDAEFKSNSSLESFDSVSVAGAQGWTSTSYGAKMSGYSSGAKDNEDWLISPAIDLNGYTNAKLQLNQAINYLNDQWDQVQVVISTDYDGNKNNIASATWTPVTIDTLPTGGSWTFVTSEKVDISAYDGKTIYVAFKYLSTTSNAATWEIDWLKVYGTVPSKAAINAPAATSGLYHLSGSTWSDVASSDYYELVAADYNSMGSPGKYDNFSSSDNPDNYLPQFLTAKYPYAQEGDQMLVVYKYYAGGGVTETRIDEYVVTDGAWVKYAAILAKTSQFVNVGDHWIFDPTIRHTMVSADYQMIVDYVKADATLSQYVDSYGTAESYYGASAYYSEFNGLVSQHTDPAFDGLSDAEAQALVQQRIKEGIIIFLKKKYTSAVAQVSGVDVMYEITYTFYTGGAPVNYTSTFQCTKSAPSPDFEFVSGPVAAK